MYEYQFNSISIKLLHELYNQAFNGNINNELHIMIFKCRKEEKQFNTYISFSLCVVCIVFNYTKLKWHSTGEVRYENVEQFVTVCF